MHLSKPHWDGNHLIINFVNPTAGLFAGDYVDMTVRICPKASAVLTSPSATRIFRAKDSSGRAQITQRLLVEGGGKLDLFPEMLIAHAGARYAQRTRIEVQPGGELLFIEMIAPGRTASGESFEYEELEFALDLIIANKLALREAYRLMARDKSLVAIRRVFANAYYASGLIVSPRPAGDNLREAISSLNSANVVAGASRPAEGVYAIKLITADSISLRVAVAGLRAIGYSYLEWPEPRLRKL
jgi:urease accessory protein